MNSRPHALLRVPVVVLAAAVTLLIAAWVLTNVGTTIAVLIALLIYVPPFVLFWGETRPGPSVWGWNSPRSFDDELRQLLENERRDRDND